jgi:hypothetical protein
MSRFARCSILLLLLWSRSALGAQGTITGKEAEGWDTGAFNVVVGTLDEVQRDGPKELNRYSGTFLPSATLGGTFDPSLHPKLPVRFYVGKANSSIEAPPPARAVVIAVIVTGMLHADEAQPSNWIRSDICTFMPNQSALVVIKGLDDPRTFETLKKLQDARAHPNPDPYAKPPAKAPAKGTPKARN